MKRPSSDQILEFLKEVDGDFPVPLSQKVDLETFSVKLFDKATLVCKIEDEEILSMIAGYTQNLKDGLAYISVMATKRKARGQGLAEKLLKEFLNRCEAVGVDAVHIYTVSSNTSAVRLYEKFGFVKYEPKDEPRPSDLHLIYYF